jgi:hypothetical protein
MKKITFIFLLILVSANYSYSQMKMYFWLANGRDSIGYYLVDLRVTVLPGQDWKVGACNIRVSHTYTGSGSLTVKPDNPALNANRNISDSNGYLAMNTTSVASGAAIGLNILGFLTNGWYTFTPGTYRIATLRWLKIPPISTIQLHFRVPPEQFATIVYDSTVLLIYNTNYTVYNGVNIKNISSEVPKDFSLSQNYPNPFNPTTKIKFAIPYKTVGHPEYSGLSVSLKIFDILGKEIATLVNEKLNPGTYEVTFDGSNFASGIYFYRLTTDDFIDTKKLVLMK